MAAGQVHRQRGRRTARRSQETERPLDATAREVIQWFSHLLARSNYSRAESEQAFKQCLAAVPHSVRLSAEEIIAEERDLVPDEVVMHWYRSPEYVVNGRPRPLPLRGPKRSLAALVRRVSRDVSAESVLAYLLKMGTVKRVGDLYVLQHFIIFRRFSPRLQRLHHLRTVLRLLKTVEENARRRPGRRLYEFTAEGEIPVSEVRGFRKEVAGWCDDLLTLADGSLFRRARRGRPGERKVRASLSVFLNDGQKLSRLSSRRSRVR